MIRLLRPSGHDGLGRRKKVPLAWPLMQTDCIFGMPNFQLTHWPGRSTFEVDGIQFDNITLKLLVA